VSAGWLVGMVDWWAWVEECGQGFRRLGVPYRCGSRHSCIGELGGEHTNLACSAQVHLRAVLCICQMRAGMACWLLDSLA